MKIKISITTALMLATFFCLTVRGYIYPEFSGYYYTGLTPTYTNAKGEQQYSYINLIGPKKNGCDVVANTKSEFIQNYIASLPVDDGYQWKIETNNLTTNPEDFPLAAEDWNKVLTKDNIPVTACHFTQYDKDGHTGKYNDGFFLFPKYDIPEYCRIQYSKTEPMIKLINVENTFGIGDVVGGELRSKLFSGFGHIGLICYASNYSDQLYSDETLVLEVLSDDKNVIQINSHKIFKDRIIGDGYKYWGVKYGIDQKELTFQQASAVVSAGLSLKGTYPDISYNLADSKIWLGGYKQIMVKIGPATFIPRSVYVSPYVRCDSFVRYCYLQAGFNIENKYPDKTYNYMSFKRKEKDNNFNILQSFYVNKNGDLESNITLFLQNNETDLNTLLQYLTEYISTTQYTNDHKANFIWNEAINKVENETTYQLLLDSLAKLNSLSISNEILDKYQKETKILNKARLINILRSSIVFKTVEETEKLSVNDIAQVNKIQNFFQSEADYILSSIYFSDVNLTNPKSNCLSPLGYTKSPSGKTIIEIFKDMKQRNTRTNL